MKQRIAFVRSTQDIDIAYALSGEGPPLVRAGTWLTHVQHDWDSPVWLHWFRLMSERHTLVRYDPRGCGLSQENVKSLNFADWVDDLAAVVDRLGLDRFPLFGMSQGAAVAVAYALRYPERVSHLTLYAPVITGWDRGNHPFAQRWRNMEQLVQTGWGEDNLAFAAMFAHLFIPGAKPEHIRWYAQAQRKSASKTNAALVMRMLAGISLFSKLPQLQVPTLLVQIAGDQCINPAAAPGIASQIPQCTFVSIDSKNHILLEDEPAWQDFTTIFRQHIPGPVTPSPPSQPKDGRLAELSKRELEILSEIAKGGSNQIIAEALFISEKTVRNHITNIFDKLGVSTRAQAIVLAKDLGI